MTEKEGRVCSAKCIARADDGVGFVERNGFDRDVGIKNGRGAADATGSAALANRGARESEFNEATTSERVTEAALPADERCAGKCFGECGAFEFPCLERAGAVTLQPETTSTDGGANRRKARGETRAVSTVGREVVHLVIEALCGDGEIAGVAGENREGGTVAQANGARRPVRVRGGKTGVEDFQRVKTSGHEWADEIEGKNQRLISEIRVERARGEEQSQMRGYAGVRNGGDVGAPAEFAREPFDATMRGAVSEMCRVSAVTERVETADAEVTACDKDWPARGAPRFARNRCDECAQSREPTRRSGFVETASGGEGERHGFAAVLAEDGCELQRAFAAQQGGVSSASVAEAGETAGGRDSDGRQRSHGGDGRAAEISRRGARGRRVNGCIRRDGPRWRAPDAILRCLRS